MTMRTVKAPEVGEHIVDRFGISEVQWVGPEGLLIEVRDTAGRVWMESRAESGWWSVIETARTRAVARANVDAVIAAAEAALGRPPSTPDRTWAS